MKVKIKDYIYKIIEVDEKHPKLQCANNTSAFGMTVYREQKIYLDKSMPSQRKRNTLIHELTHAFIESYGFYRDKDIYDNESICEFVGTYAQDILNIVDRYFKNKRVM